LSVEERLEALEGRVEALEETVDRDPAHAGFMRHRARVRALDAAAKRRTEE
jgi:hypothetical protein